MLMMPPTYLTWLEVGAVRRPGRGAGGRAAATVEMFTPGVEPLGEGWTLSMPDRLRPLLAARTASMTEPWAGGTFGERARCLLAPNPGMMTLDGTNTWVLREPGASRSVVVDPGPIEDGHLDVLDEQTGDVGLVLVTHHHFDHSEAAASFAARKGCAVRALDPAYCFDADPLADGEVIDVDGLRLGSSPRPATPPTRSRCCCPAERALLTGDMVLGRGTTVIA